MTQERYYWHPHQPVRGELPVAYKETAVAWREAYAACQKADVAYKEATTARREAYAACQKADATYKEATTAWRKTDATWWETYATVKEAYAAWRKTDAACSPAIEALHKVECPNCPWDSSSILPQKEGA